MAITAPLEALAGRITGILGALFLVVVRWFHQFAYIAVPLLMMRIAAAFGVGVVSYNMVGYASDTAIAAIRGYLSSLPAFALNFAAHFGLIQALEIILTGFITALSVQALNVVFGASLRSNR